MSEVADQPRRLPPRLVFGLFAAIVVALGAAYWFLLEPSYAPLFTQMRASDASAVVAQLDAKGVPRRLADNGTTVLVPQDRLDDARVMIAGSDIPTKGAVGFELFNKSDMGLTDFAQKINYQRALQGELERTIMLTDGVERARVHLAIPERSLFRTDKSVPKAAVELVAATGYRLDEAKVAGVQRLVASAVPDLAVADVAVLDGDGRVLSSQDDAAAADAISPAAEQRQAVERYYRARARAAIAQAAPGERVEVEVEARPIGSDEAPAVVVPVGDDGSTEAARRDFSLRIVLVTPAPLDAAAVETLRDAVSGAVALNGAAGDVLLFRVSAAGTSAAAQRAPAAAGRFASTAPSASRSPWSGAFVWGAFLAALLAAAALTIRRRNAGARLSGPERDALADRLRHALHDGGRHAAS